jgi:putative tricarboxylic transport membrane protein
MRVANLVLGLAVAAIGVVAFVEASDLDMFGEHGVPGPGFLPNLLAGTLLVLGLLLAAITLVRWRGPAPRVETGTGEEETVEVRGLLRAARVWIGFVVSIPVMALIGFVPAMVILVAYLVFVVERIKGVKPVLAAILVPAFVYAVFAFLLGVDLPASSLFGQS